MRILACCALLVCLSCASPEKQWSFTLSRWAYSDDGEFLSAGFQTSTQDASCESLAVLVAFMALPLAIDVVLLPVTGVHDLCTADLRKHRNKTKSEIPKTSPPQAVQPGEANIVLGPQPQH